MPAVCKIQPSVPASTSQLSSSLGVTQTLAYPARHPYNIVIGSRTLQEIVATWWCISRSGAGVKKIPHFITRASKSYCDDWPV